MKNITVCVSDNTYRAGRVWAAKRDTSLSAIVQYFLETLPTMPRANHIFPDVFQDLAKLPESSVRSDDVRPRRMSKLYREVLKHAQLPPPHPLSTPTPQDL